MDDWKSQNNLIDKVIEYVKKRRGKRGEPSLSTLKRRISPMVQKWRAKSAGDGS
jgi:hypothetical protein